jgi:hypothetical protein
VLSIPGWWVEKRDCWEGFLWADDLCWWARSCFVWIIVYLSGPPTIIVGPKALGGLFRCALLSVVVVWIVACSLFMYRCFSTHSTYTLLSAPATLQGMLRERVFVLLLVFV